MKLRRSTRHLFVRQTIAAVERYFWRPSLFPWIGPRRSERREALVLVVRALLHFCDLVSLRVILAEPRPDGTVRGVERKILAKLTGLTLRRVDRALADLHTAGYVYRAPQPRELVDGRYRAKAARRVIQTCLWRDLGMAVALDERRREEAKKRRKARARRDAAAVRTAIKPAARRVIAERQPPADPLAPRTPAEALAWSQLAIDTMAERPDLGEPEIRALVAERWRARRR